MDTLSWVLIVVALLVLVLSLVAVRRLPASESKTTRWAFHLLAVGMVVLIAGNVLRLS